MKQGIVVGQLIVNNATDEQFNAYPNLDAKYGHYATVANKWVDVFKTRVVNIGDFKMSGTNKLITKEPSQL